MEREVETETDRFVVTYQVLASEPAILVRQTIPVGSTAQIGDLLGVADSSAQLDPQGADTELSSAPVMRVVARLRDPDDEL
jgi:hypothetical protein